MGLFERMCASVSRLGSSVYDSMPSVSTKHQSGISVLATIAPTSVTGLRSTAHLKSTPNASSTALCPTRCPPRNPPCDPPTTHTRSGSQTPSLMHRRAIAEQSMTSRTPAPPPAPPTRLCSAASPYPVLPR